MRLQGGDGHPVPEEIFLCLSVKMSGGELALANEKQRSFKLPKLYHAYNADAVVCSTITVEPTFNINGRPCYHASGRLGACVSRSTLLL